MVLGINERNINYIYSYNDRINYPLADDKLLTKELLQKNGFPTPKLIKAYQYFFQLTTITDDLAGLSGFVVKPTRSMGGGGILIFDAYEDDCWITSSGESYNADQMFQHGSLILSGVFSIDNTSDAAMIEEKIQLDGELSRITYKGIPDIRVIVFKGHPVMAMLRIPTKKSRGRANLHVGGIGVGIDIDSGTTFVSNTYRNAHAINPDNGEHLVGLQIPYWDDIIRMSKEIQQIVPLGYMGIDYVIDKRYGPQILELNVRPGLEIQNVNGTGLKDILHKLEETDERN